MANRHTQTCAIAGALNILGDSWTLLLIREAFYGSTRFSEFQRNTGIARNLLTDRLEFLVDEEIFRKVDVGERGTRYAYVLTDKGLALDSVLVALTQWSNEHVFGAGNEPMLMFEKESGRPVRQMHLQDAKGRQLKRDDVVYQPGPGASRATRRRFEGLE